MAMSDRVTKSLKSYIARAHNTNAAVVWLDVDKDIQSGCHCCEGASVDITYDLWWRDHDGKLRVESFGDLNDLLNLVAENVD